jgi:hypothetical protein
MAVRRGDGRARSGKDMTRRVVTTDQLVREANFHLVKLAIVGGVLIATTAALAVVMRYLPSGFPIRATIVSASEWLAFAVPALLYISCLISLCRVARSSGRFQWGAWTMAALTTGVWPFACLMAAVLALGNASGLDLSPPMQRTFYFAAILPLIQLSCWSTAAVIGRTF